MNISKNTSKKIEIRDIVPACVRIWNKAYKFVFVVFFVALVALGAYIWYQSIYSGQWSVDKKQQYLNAQEKSVTLKTREFDQALKDIAQRKEVFDRGATPLKNIFTPYASDPSAFQIQPSGSSTAQAQ